MFRPVCQINIGDNEFDFVTDAQFETSWKKFTDTGDIVIPHRFKKENKTIFVGNSNLFNKGDYSEIRAGHFPNKTLIFEGYVKSIKPSVPVSIEFEDAMFLLKQTSLTMSFKAVTLTELLNSVLKEAISLSTGYVKEGLERITIEAVDAKLGAFRLSRVSIVNVLEELKKTYAITSYFDGHKLRVGLAYYNDGVEHEMVFGRNIIDSGTNLEYLKEDDLSFKVRATSLLPDNKKIEVEVGDPNGESRDLFKYNVTETELKEWATREIGNLKYEGFRGVLRTFFDPVVRHGDSIKLVDPFNPERNGIYLVESVSYEFGINGYFQDIRLGIRLDVS